MPLALQPLLHEITRFLVQGGRPIRDGDTPEAYLDRVSSSARWRALERLVTLRRWRKALSRIVKRSDSLRLGAVPIEGAPAPLLLRAAPTLRARLKLLHEVFEAGGYETAEELAHNLEREVIGASRMLRRRALPLFTRVWMTVGEAHRAMRLWEAVGSDFAADHPSRQALQLDLGLVDRPRWSRGHTFHPYLADAAVRRDQLGSDQIAAFLAVHPLTVLLNPEIDLVLHNALNRTDPSNLTALNRYLRRHGVSPLRSRSGPFTSLGELTSSSAPSSRGPLISVIMSARNAESTIGYAVDSILCQTHEPLELLIADDESDDRTLHVLRDRYGRDPRVKLFRSERNQGTYNVRNQLVERARGEFVTFQDSDDLSLPTRLARQAEAIRHSGGVGCVCEWLRVRPDGSIAFFSNGRAARLSIVSLLVRRTVLRDLAPYPGAKVGADLDMYRRILQRFGHPKMIRLNTPLLLGLWSDRSLTRTALAESLESGYRSPTRRRYSELVFRRDLFGVERLSEASLLDELRAMNNYLEPSRLIPCTNAS
jgi:hypothetical protein